MKKLIIYIAAGVICIIAAFFPIDKILQETKGDFSKESIEAEAETIETSSSPEVFSAQDVPSMQTVSDAELFDYKSFASFGESFSSLRVDNDILKKSIEEKTADEEEDKENKESEDDSSTDNKKAEKPVQGTIPVTIGPTHNAIPNVAESTQFCGQDINNSVRQKLVAALGCSGGYSSDCQNVAVMRINGSNKSAGTIFADYGNNVTWKETSAYEYTIGLADNQLNDCVSRLCNNLSKDADGCDRLGIGVNISKEDEYYRIKVSVVFSN